MTQLSRTMKLFMLYGCLTLVLLVHGQDQSGFITIDCGISEGSDYTDENSTIFYTSDAGYIDTGTNHNISLDYMSANVSRRQSNLRSFPDGIKNCYTIHQAQAGGDKYLIRAIFKYGNYDSKNQPPEFALYVDGDQWHTVRFNASDVVYVEIIHIIPATTAYIHVCLVKTGLGTPFISGLELRRLNNSIYQTHSGSLKFFNRVDLGSTTNKTVRYPDDVYDRIWISDTFLGFTSPASAWKAISSSYNTDALSANDYKPPYPVMATAISPVNGSNSLNFRVKVGYPRQQLYVFMHFAEIGPVHREFDIYINNASWSPGVVTNYLRPVTISSPYSMSADLQSADLHLNFSIRATAQSTLPPILNAIEVYEVIELRSPTPTHQSEFEAIKNIKLAYRVGRNWQGDPCVPKEYSWEDLQCHYDGSTRIISLNLSSSSLSGNMDFSFSGLTSLESLDLSNNNLTGPVPDFLSKLPSLKTLNLSRNNFTGSIPHALIEKSKIGSLTLSTEGNLHLAQAENVSKCQVDSCAKKKNFVVPAFASIASCLVIVVVILAIWWSLKIRKQQDEMVEEKKRQFTHSELMTITRNFTKPLGRGAFGSVYVGHLTDGTQVAVKMLSPVSTQGSKQFRTEVQLLTKVHHRNLVSIIGYCNEGQHMGLVYEYMANGTVEEHLSEKNPKTLSWEKRLQIACDAAEGLAYLHDGCKPPIIHRDIKTTNLLLTENMQAKVSDFGLSRLMPSDGGTHVSTAYIAGTRGYMDPEYLEFNMLNEKSDVYSFGVVLLELITGKPAVLKPHKNTLLANWIVPMVERAEIMEIMDSRLNSDFDTNSTQKALNTAMACVERNLSQRMVMRQVVANLRECLEIEKARVKARKENEEHNSMSVNTDYAIVESLIGGPSVNTD